MTERKGTHHTRHGHAMGKTKKPINIKKLGWDTPTRSPIFKDGPNTTTTIIFQKHFASDATAKRHLMAHQMKILCVLSVFHCVERAFGAATGGGDGSLPDTIPGDPEALRGLSPSPPPPPPPNPAAPVPPVPPENPPGGQTLPKDTVTDTETESQDQEDAQMR